MLRSPALPTRRKAVKTYGKTSRSKAASFKVFQDAVDRDGAEKKNWPEIPSSPPIIRQNITGSISGIDLTDDVRDPFEDPLSLSSIGDKIDSQSGLSRVDGPKALNSTATSRHNGKRGLKATALTEKSTNHPVLIKSAAPSEEIPESATASLLRQNIQNHRTKKQKFHNTPRVILDAKTPSRPRKRKYLKPTDEQLDFLAAQSPTKIRGHITQEDELDETYSEGPKLLGTPNIDMGDNTSTASVTWVRERARDIFSGTRKAAGKILGVTPSNAKCRNQKKERSKLKGIIKNGANKDSSEVMNNHLQVMQKENIDFRAGHTNGIFGKNKKSVGLHKFSQEPPFHLEDYQNKGSGDEDPLGLHKTTDPSRQKDFWRSENIEDLLMSGSAKARCTKKGKQYSSKYPTGNEDPNSFQTSANISPQGSRYDPSDNEMPSSSPLFKSTPNPNQEKYHSASNKNPFYSNANFCKAMDMEGLLNEGSSDENNETTKFDEDELLNGGGRYKEKLKKNVSSAESKHLMLRAASSEDELCQAPYDTETFGKEDNMRRGNEESSHKKKNVKTLDTALTTKTIGEGSKKELNRGRKNGKDIIHVGGSRTSNYVPKDSKIKGTVEGVEEKTDKSNRTRAPLKKKSSGRIGKGRANRETRKQRPSRGYERLEDDDDDDMDELQMDLPSMMI